MMHARCVKGAGRRVRRVARVTKKEGKRRGKGGGKEGERERAVKMAAVRRGRRADRVMMMRVFAYTS